MRLRFGSVWLRNTPCNAYSSEEDFAPPVALRFIYRNSFSAS